MVTIVHVMVTIVHRCTKLCHLSSSSVANVWQSDALVLLAMRVKFLFQATVCLRIDRCHCSILCIQPLEEYGVSRVITGKFHAFTGNAPAMVKQELFRFFRREGMRDQVRKERREQGVSCLVSHVL